MLAAVFFWLAQPGFVSILAGVVVVLMGLVIRGWAAGVLEKDRKLAVSGPYAFTRNPLYLGSFVIGIGVVIAGARPWFGLLFLAFFGVVYRGAMLRESDRLADRFGAAYRRYNKSVPLFFPRGARYQPGPASGTGSRPTPFSVARYLRNREYEALLGAAAGFGLLALKAAG